MKAHLAAAPQFGLPNAYIGIAPTAGVRALVRIRARIRVAFAYSIKSIGAKLSGKQFAKRMQIEDTYCYRKKTNVPL